MERFAIFATVQWSLQKIARYVDGCVHRFYASVFSWEHFPYTTRWGTEYFTDHQKLSARRIDCNGDFRTLSYTRDTASPVWERLKLSGTSAVEGTDIGHDVSLNKKKRTRWSDFGEGKTHPIIQRNVDSVRWTLPWIMLTKDSYRLRFSWNRPPLDMYFTELVESLKSRWRYATSPWVRCVHQRQLYPLWSQQERRWVSC